MAAADQYLYVALVDRNLQQLLDVWDVRDPGAPRLVDTLDFGNAGSSPFAFTPVALAALRGTVVLEANSSLYLYRHGVDGRLELLRQDEFVTGWGVPAMNQISFAGPYASHLQQVVENRYVGTIPDERIHEEVFLDLSNPAAPFLIRGQTPPPQLNFLAGASPLNSLYRGEPASLTFDSMGGTASLVAYHPLVDAHFKRFWSSKLTSVFRANALDSSIETLLQAAVGNLDLPTLKTNLIDAYTLHVAGPAADLGGLIRSRHAVETTLEEILPQYAISPEEPLSTALARIVAQGCDAELESAMARLIHAPALQSWLNTTLAVSGPVTAAQYESAVASVFDAELSSAGVARYLTQEILAPLMGNPAFMRWSLQDLIDDLAASPAGSAVDGTLTVTGAGAIDEALDFVDMFAPLPDCARFPRSARELLNTALLEHGADLDPNGLAWFELLKFYSYARGDGNYGRLTSQIDERFRQLHRALGADLFRKFAGAAAFARSANWDTSQWSQEVAAGNPVRQVVASAISEALLNRLTAYGVQGNMSVRQALSAWNLHLNEVDLPRARVGDLLDALTTRGLDRLLLTDLFQQARTGSDDLRVHLVRFLRQRTQKALGVEFTNWSLREALVPFVLNQIDLSALGEAARESLSLMLEDAFHNVSFSGYITSAAHAFDGDCIAQWLLALEVARGATLFLDGGSTATAISVALTAAYREASEYCVGLLIRPLANTILGEMSGSYASWTAQLQATSYGPFTVFPGPDDQNRIIRQGWVWQDYAGFVVQTRPNADPNNSKHVRAVFFKPDAPQAAAFEVDLGQWTNLDYVHMADGTLYLGGSYFLNDAEAIPTGRVMLLDLTQRPIRVQRMTAEPGNAAALATHFITINQGAHFALAAGAGVLFLPNPAARETQLSPAESLQIGRVQRGKDGSISFVVRGRQGDLFRIEVSLNLKDWHRLATLLNESGEVKFTDPGTPGPGQAYYRVTAE